MDARVWPIFSFTVPGIPVPWARAGSRAGIRFTPSKQRHYGVAVRECCTEAMQGAAPIKGPVELTVRAVYVPPASWSTKKRDAARWRTGRPDADNIAKLVADNLNGIAWLDDAQIADLRVQKVYGIRAELVVSIRDMAS